MTPHQFQNPHPFVCSANHGIQPMNRKKGWMLKGANGCGPLPKLNPVEEKVLALLASGSEDFGFFSFKGIAFYVRLKRPIIRRACRSLARKGLARFAFGLWSLDYDRPAGSGYGATKEGRARADERLVERYAQRQWE